MHNHRFTRLALAAATLALSACSSNPTKEEIGMVSGAVIGGIVGSTLTGGSGAGTVTGAAAGSYLGNKIAREIDHKK